MANLLTYPPVLHVDREEFFASGRWHYKPGGHVTILGPTDAGKSQLMMQLLQHTATPELPSLTLATKPRDATLDRWRKILGHRVVRKWPPVWSPFRNNNPAGWVLWPKHSFDPEMDDWNLEREFRRAFAHVYKHGDMILNADESLPMIDLGLWKWMRTLHTRGRSMGAGLWLNNQGPTDIGRYAYRQAAHLFLFYDPDLEARKRFDQIGGVDPGLVRAVTAELPPYHCLYIRRKGRVMCVVGP